MQGGREQACQLLLILFALAHILHSRTIVPHGPARTRRHTRSRTHTHTRTRTHTHTHARVHTHTHMRVAHAHTPAPRVVRPPLS